MSILFSPLCKYHAVVDYLHKNTIQSISRGIKQSSKQCICFSGLELSANFTSSPIWRDGTSLQKVTLSLQSQKKPNSYHPHKAPRLHHLSPPHTLSLIKQPAAPHPESHCVSTCRYATSVTVTPLPATSPHATLTNVHVTCPQSSSQSCPFFSRSLIFTSGCFLRTTQDTALLPVPLALTFYLQLASVAQSCPTVCDPMSLLFTTPKCWFTTRGLPPAWPFHPVCHPLSLPLSETSPRLSCAPPLRVCVCVCMRVCVLNRLVMSDSLRHHGL